MRFLFILFLFAPLALANEWWQRPIPLVRFNYQTRNFDRGKLTREGIYRVTFRAEFPGEEPHVFTEPLASHLLQFWESGRNPMDRFWYINKDHEDLPSVVQTWQGEHARRIQLSEVEFSTSDDFPLTLHFFEPGDPYHVMLTSFPQMNPYGVTGGSRNLIFADRLRYLWGNVRISCASLISWP